MPFAWQPQDRDVINHWLNTIVDEASDDLSAWELKFISDMQIRLQNGWKWTEAQEKKLEQIYADKTK
jgi:hypothetical protein